MWVSACACVRVYVRVRACTYISTCRCIIAIKAQMHIKNKFRCFFSGVILLRVDAGVSVSKTTPVSLHYYRTVMDCSQYLVVNLQAVIGLR